MPSKSLVGVQLWKNRTIHGRDRIFGNANNLLNAAFGYFDWCKANPLHKRELVKYQGFGSVEEVELDRPFTEVGLCIHLGVSSTYFIMAVKALRRKVEDGVASENEVDLLDAINQIYDIIREQNVTMALVNLYNPFLIARIHGLTDKVEANEGESGGVVVTVRDTETAKVLTELDSLL